MNHPWGFDPPEDTRENIWSIGCRSKHSNVFSRAVLICREAWPYYLSFSPRLMPRNDATTSFSLSQPEHGRSSAGTAPPSEGWRLSCMPSPCATVCLQAPLGPQFREELQGH